MTLLDERTPTMSGRTYRLNPDGVSVLLVYGAHLYPPLPAAPGKPAQPGIRVTVDAHGTCLLEAVGYPDRAAGTVAICAAAQVCLDADLVVSFPPSWVETTLPARIVRRRSR